MRLFISFLLLCVSMNLNIFSFNFFLNPKKPIDFFWHLKIPALQFLPIKSEQIIKVAVLDTFFEQKTISRLIGPPKNFNLNRRVAGCKNLGNGERFLPDCHFYDDGQKKSAIQDFVGNFFPSLVKKNHGACAATLMKQIMPDLEIISISIFNERGITSKKKLYDGLQQALRENIDILYLGLKIEKDEDDSAQDQEIIQLLSCFSYVVVAAGNDAKYESQLAFPACAHNIFFSVGAFEKIEEEYIISDFSQFQQNIGPNFVMPGKDLACYIWSDHDQIFVPVIISGTSMAAALFVGYLAYTLALAKQNFSVEQIQCILKKCAVMLHEKKWDGKVKFGTLFVEKIIQCLNTMQYEEKEILQEKSMKKFERKLVEIIQKLGEK